MYIGGSSFNGRSRIFPLQLSTATGVLIIDWLKIQKKSYQCLNYPFYCWMLMLLMIDQNLWVSRFWQKHFFWVARRQQFSKPWNEQMILFMKCEVSYLTTWFFSESRICRPQKNHNECEKFLEKNHEKWNAVAIITWEAKLYQTVLNFSLTFQNSIHFTIVWKKK